MAIIYLQAFVIVKFKLLIKKECSTGCSSCGSNNASNCSSCFPTYQLITTYCCPSGYVLLNSSKTCN